MSTILEGKINLSILLIALILIGCVVMGQHYRDKVAEKSARYNALLSLNARYHFNSGIRNQYIYEKQLNSKAQFDRFRFDKYFNEIAEKDFDLFDYIIKQANDNQRLLKKYEEELLTLPAAADRQEAREWNIPFFLYQRIEDSLIKNKTLKPVISPTVLCKISYTSPKGRNSYANSKSYAFPDILEYRELVMKQTEARRTKEHQRKINGM